MNKCSNCDIECVKGNAPFVVVCGQVFESLCSDCWSAFSKIQANRPFRYTELNRQAKERYLASKGN